MVGGWQGKLSNSGETIRLVDAAGAKVDEVSYADAGDWALRARGPMSFGHKGWVWNAPADGGGKTLELINPTLASANSGQNWAASTPVGGTPGAANSRASGNVAPLIVDAKHRPKIPHSSDPIVVSAKFVDEVGALSATQLHWRVDAGTWQTAPMADSDGDGDREATIPPQPNLTVLEYYIEASDGANTRTWPAPARTSDPGVLPETFAQVTNALLQVDDSFDPQPRFHCGGKPTDLPLHHDRMPSARSWRRSARLPARSRARRR